MSQLDDLRLFVRVAEAGAISTAARTLGLSPAAASAALKRLERRLDARLFERSTRSLRLTPAGEAFLGHCAQALEVLDGGLATLRHGREELSGDIHLGAPSDLGRGTLDAVLEDFRRRHPQIRLILHLADGMHDLYRNPLDLVLRYGGLRDSSLVARKLCDNHRVVCAAPAYLARAGRPATPAELAAHNCLCFYLSNGLYDRWRLTLDGRQYEIDVRGDRAAADGALVHQWALDGHGIAYKSRLDIRADLAAGRLVDLFPRAACEPAPLYAVYPSRRHQPARVKALVDDLERTLGPERAPA
ncbi:LysR family transcriptional regulator [Pseudothauera nasutitermitis]|uniref:LysR family transcriptional regulator n=1 Tax=Pseudothauera nasutitermitis TaxID=2565930 RepID=A0A4S4B1F1_9RHOO|nr:LysR family transcriptional regulator [Pseudothauera nasutitermitis]THF64748.1 LysR family transcriptional regulator [Pseudothauera nasutitermitis]